MDHIIDAIATFIIRRGVGLPRPGEHVPSKFGRGKPTPLRNNIKEYIMFPLIHLQEYIRFTAHDRREVVALPPFTLFFHATSASTEYNFALLDTSESGDLQEALTRLPTPFIERQRKPCVQFIEEVFPQLTPLLRSAGWTEEARSQMMLCTPETYQPVPDVPGLAII